MADNTRLPQPASNGDLVATDEITGGVANGAKVQRVKLGFGADGAYADVEGSNPLPVAGAVTVAGVATATAQATAQTAIDAIKVATEASATATGQTTGNATLAAIKTAVEGTLDVAVASLPSVTIGSLPSVTIGDALPAGSNALGSVSVSALPALAAGSNVIGHVVTDSGSTVAVSALPALPAGANAIGSVSVSSLPNVTIGAALPAGSNALGSVAVTSAPTTAVTIATLPALAAGNNNIGDVDVASLPALPAGANTIGKVDQGAAGADEWPVSLGASTLTFHTGTVTSGAGASVKASPGRVFHLEIDNATGGTVVVNLYNTATPSVGDAYVSVQAATGNSATRDLGARGMKFDSVIYYIVTSAVRSVTPAAVTAVGITIAYE